MTDRLAEIEGVQDALHDIPDDISVPVSAGLARDLLAVERAARAYLIARENVHHLVPQYRGATPRRPRQPQGRDVTPWRTGRKVGRTIYLQLGPEPSDDDLLIGVMDTPALAAEAVDARNRALGPKGGAT